MRSQNRFKTRYSPGGGRDMGESSKALKGGRDLAGILFCFHFAVISE